MFDDILNIDVSEDEVNICFEGWKDKGTLTIFRMTGDAIVDSTPIHYSGTMDAGIGYCAALCKNVEYLIEATCDGYIPVRLETVFNEDTVLLLEFRK